MKKFEFVSQTRQDKPNENWYYTKQDGSFISNSGSYDKIIAYEKFTLLTQGGSLEPIVIVLEEIIIEPKN